jgi:hypothetical protein
MIRPMDLSFGDSDVAEYLRADENPHRLSLQRRPLTRQRIQVQSTVLRNESGPFREVDGVPG